jgi:hypothetical protein
MATIVNWIYWITLNYGYSVLQCTHFTTHYSRPQHKAGTAPQPVFHCTVSSRLSLYSSGPRTSCRPTSQSPNCRLRLLCPWPPSQGPEPPLSDWLSELFSEDSPTLLWKLCLQLTNSELNSATNHWLALKVKVTLRPTISRSVSPGFESHPCVMTGH